MQRLTREQAAIIGAYTGITLGPFSDIQKLAEDTFGRPVWTHEFAGEQFMQDLRKAVKPKFIQLCAEG